MDKRKGAEFPIWDDHSEEVYRLDEKHLATKDKVIEIDVKKMPKVKFRLLNERYGNN